MTSAEAGLSLPEVSPGANASERRSLMATKAINLDTTLVAEHAARIAGNLKQWISAKQQWAPVALRLPLGVIFFAHGAQKLLGWFGGYGWHGTMQYFTQSLHIPAPLAAIAILAEFFGGLALVAGVFTRWAALLTAVDMLVAAILVHLPNGFFLNWMNQPNRGHGIEYNIALIGAALALALLGGGRLSIDQAFEK
jgi:putative oxidoreductase